MAAIKEESDRTQDQASGGDPLPLDQLLCYSPSTVHSWPAEHREQILAVADRNFLLDVNL